MRRFVALPVPSSARSALSTSLAPLHERFDDRLRWTRPEGWHVTLAFLGEVGDDHVPAVVEVVEAAVGRAHVPRTLRLAAPGRFGRGVLWVGVVDDPEGSVAALGGAVQRALVDAGLPVQEQPVVPHVTVARSRRTRDRAVTPQVVGAVEIPSVSWEVAAVELWRSRLGDGPARYELDTSLPVR